MVTLTITGDKETVLVGEAPIFGSPDYKKGFGSGLKNLGFWLTDWHYNSHGGPSNKSKVFIPWGSCLMVQELK